jgi:hypothetical protein
VEAKGKFDRDARRKMELVAKQHPDLDIRLLFMRDNKISKQSKTRYTDWCRVRGIKCSVSSSGDVPQEWTEVQAVCSSELQDTIPECGVDGSVLQEKIKKETKPKYVRRSNKDGKRSG